MTNTEQSHLVYKCKFCGNTFRVKIETKYLRKAQYDFCTYADEGGINNDPNADDNYTPVKPTCRHKCNNDYDVIGIAELIGKENTELRLPNIRSSVGLLGE